MRKILALLSHGENEVTSPHNHIGGSGCSSSGLQLGKQVTINNQRFTLDSVIAEGGFGIVYRVHSSSGRRFALKRTLVNSEAGVSAMKREITIVSSLSHKNIVSYITSQVSEKEPGIYEVLLLTAYYPSSVSRILNERQQKKEAFLESEVLRILADLCEAVSRLHHCQTPIIHRDLKVGHLNCFPRP
uniref:non-specific serine/threonine protein kinase n=1 Tax=Mesocestoides corti TaxID=53468 RepID=A0A5K3FSQ6_MESCO